MKSFDEVQARYGDIPGEEGARLRARMYAPYFLRFGRDVYIGEGCRFFHPDRIVLEDDARFNDGVLVYGSGGVWIGSHARIGPRCFIHSANHDVSDAPTAYFERKYIEAPVRLGSDALLSANVSILPGVTLGDHCFAACGAVVAKGQYPSGSKLFGVPARAVPPAEAAPVETLAETLVLTPREGAWHRVFAHLLSTLGLPQVGLAAEGDAWPAGVRSVLLAGPATWSPSLPSGLEAWRLVDGSRAAPAAALPRERLFKYAFAGQDGGDDIGAELAQALFWLLVRLEKGAGRLSLQEFHEWLVALQWLDLDRSVHGELLARILGGLRARRPRLLPGARQLCASDGRLSERLQQMQARVERLLRQDRMHGAYRTAITAADALLDALSSGVGCASSIDAMRQKVLQSRKRNPTVAQRAIARLASGRISTTAAGMRNSRELLACCLAAHKLGDEEAFRRWDGILASPAWRVAGISFPRLKPGAAGFNYSPMVMIWLFARACARQPGYKLPSNLGLDLERKETLEWRGDEHGQFLNRERREISSSLFFNWERLHRADCPDGAQFVLDRGSYQATTRGLEAIWVQAFKAIQHAASRPLLRLRPWPAPYKAALSLRYDVDRPVSADRITELVRLQIRLAKAALGSWYYFSGHPDLGKQAGILGRHWQEQAIHAQAPQDALPGRGVTHHSAPTSQYWRGDGTSESLARRGASYGEFLASCLHTPRPWLGADPSQACALWLTPLHFPLEGSTSDVDLGYFDQLLTEFREVLASGGHAIIGSHPDLNQQLLSALFEREDFGNVWMANVAEVVARCRRVLGLGQISVVAGKEEDMPCLYSAQSIGDLAVECWLPGHENPVLHTLQLQAKVPRPVPAST